MSTGTLQSIYEEILAGKTIEIPMNSVEEVQILLGRLRVIKSRYDAKTEAMFGDRVSEGKILSHEWTRTDGADFLGFVRIYLKQPDTPRYSYKIIDVSPQSESPEADSEFEQPT